MLNPPSVMPVGIKRQLVRSINGGGTARLRLNWTEFLKGSGMLFEELQVDITSSSDVPFLDSVPDAHASLDDQAGVHRPCGGGLVG